MKKALIFATMLILVSGIVSAQVLQKQVAANGTRFVASAEVLYDQTDNPSGNGAPDQLFEATYSGYSSEGADDFEVTDAAGWDIDGVNTEGTGGGSIHVNATFYEDSSGLPGAVACEELTITTYVDAAGALEITLPNVCSLGTGVYWYAQEVRQDFVTAGQHFWSNRLVQSGNPALWRNPSNGFATGCLDWSEMAAVCGVGGGTNPDFLFQILGPDDPDGGDGGTPTPAVGPFGLLLMVLALGGGSGYVLARRRR